MGVTGPAMKGWWVCSNCGNEYDPVVPDGICTVCNHQVTVVDIGMAQIVAEREQLSDAYSESSFAESLFSDQPGFSRTSAISTDMTEAGTTALLQVLLDDDLIVSCAHEALHGGRIPRPRFQNKLRRLLNQWSQDLKGGSGAETYEEHVAPQFIRRFARNASHQLCAFISGDDGKFSQLSTLPDERDYRVKVESYIQQGRDRYQKSKRPSKAAHRDSDDSQFDSDGDDNDLEPEFAFPNLERLRSLLVEGKAYDTLKYNLFHFMYPTFHQRIKKIMRKYPDLEFANPRQRQTIMSEMRYTLPGSFRSEDQESGGWVNQW
ncbi:hypothetical protein BJY04DRAFT_219345 [Aspergillus karnatakaensis]|uniref:uncharacterized protein n=1 Tax=Aspergillus karnatakaensis TaxID=1810916 RepID=UPI003CCD2059